MTPSRDLSSRVNIRAIRTNLGLGQGAFARRFGFNLSDIRDWERGIRRPEQHVCVLLLVIAHAPDVIEDALVYSSKRLRS